MATQMQQAREGRITDAMKIVAEEEHLPVETIREADAVMDLSTGNNIDVSRQRIIEHSPIMVGTVPLYQATVRSIREHGAVVEMTDDDILETIEQQAKDGADFMTLHCGVTRSAIERMRRQGRVMDIVSRGGSFIAGWMLHNEMENPLY